MNLKYQIAKHIRPFTLLTSIGEVSKVIVMQIETSLLERDIASTKGIQFHRPLIKQSMYDAASYLEIKM